MIKPFLSGIPRETLKFTLEAARKAVEGTLPSLKSDLGDRRIMGRNSEISGNPVNEPVMGTSVQVTNGTPGDAPEWGLNPFRRKYGCAKLGSSDEVQPRSG